LSNAYDKTFKSWDHPVALIFAQFSCASSLRGLIEEWNANRQHHYHLGMRDRLKRSLIGCQ
jgi:putative transposase